MFWLAKSKERSGSTVEPRSNIWVEVVTNDEVQNLQAICMDPLYLSSQVHLYDLCTCIHPAIPKLAYLLW